MYYETFARELKVTDTNINKTLIFFEFNIVKRAGQLQL